MSIRIFLVLFTTISLLSVSPLLAQGELAEGGDSSGGSAPVVSSSSSFSEDPDGSTAVSSGPTPETVTPVASDEEPLAETGSGSVDTVAPYRSDSYPEWYTDSPASTPDSSGEAAPVLPGSTQTPAETASASASTGSSGARPAASWNPLDLGQAKNLLGSLIGSRQTEQADESGSGESKPGIMESVSSGLQALQTAGRAWSYFQGLEARVEDQGRQSALASAEQRATDRRDATPSFDLPGSGPQPTAAWREGAMARITGGTESQELLNNKDYVTWRDQVMAEYKPPRAMTAEERKSEFAGASKLEDKLAVLEAAHTWARSEGRIDVVKDASGQDRYVDARTYSPLDRRYWENMYVFGRSLYTYGVSDR